MSCREGVDETTGDSEGGEVEEDLGVGEEVGEGSRGWRCAYCIKKSGVQMVTGGQQGLFMCTMQRAQNSLCSGG